MFRNPPADQHHQRWTFPIPVSSFLLFLLFICPWPYSSFIAPPKWIVIFSPCCQLPFRAPSHIQVLLSYYHIRPVMWEHLFSRWHSHRDLWWGLCPVSSINNTKNKEQLCVQTLRKHLPYFTMLYWCALIKIETIIIIVHWCLLLMCEYKTRGAMTKLIFALKCNKVQPWALWPRATMIDDVMSEVLKGQSIKVWAEL